MKSGPVKVLLYSINYAPELTGIGKYNSEMVQWLTRQGCEVRVITAPPYYPHWRVQEGYSASSYTREELDGAVVWRCPVWVPVRASGLKRLLHLFSFAASSAPVLARQLLWKPDVVFVVEPPLAVAPLAVLLSKLMRVRTWLHVQDFEVDAAFELGLLPDRKGLRRFAEGLETWLLRRFDAVSSISMPMLRRLAAKGVPENKIRFFPNWVNLSAIHPLPVEQPNSYRTELGFGADHVVALYSGNMGEKQGLEVVLEAASQLGTDSPVRFVLCGAGAAKAKLMERAAELALGNVVFLPLQPVEQLNELLGMADIHLLVQKRGASDLVMPSKLTGMLASGRAILATADEGTAVHSALMQSGAGVVVMPEDAGQFARAVADLAAEPEARARYGASGRFYAVHQLGYESVMENFHRSLKMLKAGRAHEQEQGDKPHTVGSL